MSTLEQMAMEHHRDACLDNHTEADCVAVILAARITELEAEKRHGIMVPGPAYDEAVVRAERAEAALADLRGDATTVEIGGQVMTQAQFDAARYPLLHQDPGPTLRGGPYPYEAPRG